MLAEDTRAFQADRSSAGVVIGARSFSCDIFGATVARIVVPGHQVNTLGISRIAAAQDCIHVYDLSRCGDALTFGLHKRIGVDLQAATALTRVALEFRLDPLPRGPYASAFGDRIGVSSRKGLAGMELGQPSNGVANVRR